MDSRNMADAVVDAIDAYRYETPREERFDGNDEISCGLNVPPWNMASKIKCKKCGKISYENQVFKNECIRCGNR